MPLFMYVGKMRQGKSYCAVRKIDEITKENAENLLYNRKLFAEHLAFFTDRGEADLLEPFMKILDCEEYPEYHEQLKVPFCDFLEIYNEKHDLKLTMLKPVRQIYTDINGVIEIGKVPNILPAPDDWRTTPKGSIIFYDEFQINRPAFKFDGNRLSKNEMIIEISRIGHVDKDLYLITQDAENLNFSLRKLIDKMYFVKRPPQNINACSVYTFDCFLKNPKAAAESTRKPHKYISWEIVRYNDYIYSLYKSASSHDSVKRKIPFMFFAKTIGISLAVFGVGYMIVSSPFLHFLVGAIKTMMSSNVHSVADLTPKTAVPVPQHSSSATNTNTNAIPAANSQAKSDLDKECRQAQNVDKPECKMWFDQLTKNNASVQSASYNSTTQTVSYDPTRPYDDKDIKSKIEYQVVNQPRFSGCAKVSTGEYRAYTEQGTYLKTSASVCRRLMKDAGDRPYDYVYSHAVNAAPTSSNQNISNSTDQQIKKPDTDNKDQKTSSSSGESTKIYSNA